MNLKDSLLIVLVALLVTGAAFAQPAPTPVNSNTKIYQPDNNPVVSSDPNITVGNPGPGSSFQTIYANGLNQGGGSATLSVKVMNTGAAGGVDPGGDICVNVYVFDTSQNLQACCYCKVSPDGLGSIPISGHYSQGALVIKLVATYPNSFQPQGSQPTNSGTYACDASTPATGLDPTNTDGNHPLGIPQGTAFSGGYTAGQQYLAPGQAAWLDTVPATSVVHTEQEFHQSSFTLGEAASLAYKCGVKTNLGVGNGGTTLCPAATCSQ